MMIPDIQNSDKVRTFIRAANEYMSATDTDGIGYAAITDKNELVGERWRNPDDAFTVKTIDPNEVNKLAEIQDCILKYEANDYNSFGAEKFDQANMRAIIYHSRFATCDKTLQNLHPFVQDDIALIHNGVIHKPYPYQLTQSTCDSETILQGYIANNVKDDTLKMQYLSEKLSGYFALGIFAKTSQGNWILDIVKDNMASLDVMFVKELNTLVYCTDASIIADTCETLGWEISAEYSLQPNSLIRYDVTSGKVIEKHWFIREVKREVIDIPMKLMNARDYSDDIVIPRENSSLNNFVLPPEYDENDIAIDGDKEAMMRDGRIVQKITIDEYLRDNNTNESTQYVQYNNGSLVKKWAKGNKK
jgi:hypothetical protein